MPDGGTKGTGDLYADDCGILRSRFCVSWNVTDEEGADIAVNAGGASEKDRNSANAGKKVNSQSSESRRGFRKR